MNKPTLLTTLMLALMFLSTSFAEWEKVDESVDRSIYVDFKRIVANEGYVYYWDLVDHLKPTSHGDLSAKTYYEADCDVPQKYRVLSVLAYKESMGEGSRSRELEGDKKWQYPSPDSVIENVIADVCFWAKVNYP